MLRGEGADVPDKQIDRAWARWDFAVAYRQNRGPKARLLATWEARKRRGVRKSKAN